MAIAGGTELLLGTDIRVAGASARFGISEARWALYPMAGSAVRLPRQIPRAHAAELLLTGRHITADEALRVGLISRVVPDGEALATALEIAELINANGPIAVEAILRTLHETDGMTERAALELEVAYGHTVIEPRTRRRARAPSPRSAHRCSDDGDTRLAPRVHPLVTKMPQRVA